MNVLSVALGNQHSSSRRARIPGGFVCGREGIHFTQAEVTNVAALKMVQLVEFKNSLFLKIVRRLLVIIENFRE